MTLTILSVLYSTLLPPCQGVKTDLHMGLCLWHRLDCCDHRQKITSAQVRVKVRCAVWNTAPSKIHLDSPDYIDHVPFCEAAFRASGLLQLHPHIKSISRSPCSPNPGFPWCLRPNGSFREVKRASDLDYRMHTCDKAMISDKPRVKT